MKSIKYILLFCPFFIRCVSKYEAPINPAYSEEIESRIEKVINHLQVETSIDNVYKSKSLSEQLKHYNTPGVSIAIINNGKIEWARGFGIRDKISKSPVDIHTLFQAGSISKPTFALAVMKLKEEGKIDLDKDVNEYLQSWKIPANEEWQPKITLRQLLSHTAGLTVHGFPGYLSSEAVPSISQILDGDSNVNTAPVRVNILPGMSFRYSGGGITIAQLTIMDVLKKPFPGIMDEIILKPLNLRYSTYQQPLPDSLAKIASTAFPYKGVALEGRFHTYPEMAAAGFWTNPTELATVLMEVQSALKGKSALFKKETIDEMLTPQKVADFIGIGFFLESKGDSARFGHNGWDEGFVASATAYKNSGKGAVVMVNSNEGYALLDEILRAIAIEYKWPDYIHTPKKDYSLTKDEIRESVGTYADTTGNKVKIDSAGDKLVMVYENQAAIPLIKTESGKFALSQLNVSIELKKGSLSISQAGSSKDYKKK